MKKTLGLIVATAVATNLVWFCVAACFFYFSSTSTSTLIPEVNTNNFVFMAMRDLTNQNVEISFRETGSTPTNFVTTNRITLMRPLHNGQTFVLSIGEAVDVSAKK